MTAKHILFGTIAALVIGSPMAWGQSILTGPQSLQSTPPSSSGTGLPPGAQSGLIVDGGSTAVLIGPTGKPPVTGGVVQSPWCGGAPAGGACSGPVGGSGPITYELYARTGASLVVGGSPAFTGALRTGINATTGARTLFFEPSGDRAWAVDLGIGYTYNDGDPNRVLNIFSPAPRNAQTGNLQGPDVPHPFRVRSLHRTTVNYGLGYDWFLNGPGIVGAESAWNSRLGVDFGGRWGTNHVDLVPVANTSGYLRRSGISHSTYLAGQWTWEQPIGGWIAFGGIRAEWVYTWMNLVPPRDGDLQDVNILLVGGIRF